MAGAPAASIYSLPGSSYGINGGGYTVEEGTFICTVAAGNELYRLPYFQSFVPLHGGGSFGIYDSVTGEWAPTGDNGAVWGESSWQATWLTPPTQKSLGISTSRWSHDLWLCQPNGESFRIQQHATQGNLSFDPNQQGWFNSYYYFDASTKWHDFLDWWVEDRSTLGADGKPEKTPKASVMAAQHAQNPSSPTLESYLISGWIALPTPQNLTRTYQPHAAVELSWNRNGASNDGAFCIERRRSDYAHLAPLIITVSASETTKPDGPLQFNVPYTYSVRYTYGGRMSAVSNTVEALVPDRDWDGISDDDDQDPDNADSDGDGISDGDEGYGDTDGDGDDDAHDDDSDNDGVKDDVDRFPKDKRRSDYIRVKYYGVIDLTAGMETPPQFYPGFIKVAINDSGHVAFGGITSDGLRSFVWKDGQIDPQFSAFTSNSGLFNLRPDLTDSHAFEPMGVSPESHRQK